MECKFDYQPTFWHKNEYTCIAQLLETSETNRTITEIRGTHQNGKTNDNVESLFVVDAKCPYLPLNVGKFFKNLKTMIVMKSQVKNLTNEDLKSFNKLEVFDISYNPIERLEKGFFDGSQTLKKISFYYCDLKFVDATALDSLVNLHEARFQYNRCVDYRGSAKHLVPILKRHLKKCDGKNDINLHPDVSVEEDDDYDVADEEYIRNQEKKSQCNTNCNNEMSFLCRNAHTIIFLLVCVIIVTPAFVLLLDRRQREIRRRPLLNEDFGM